MADDEISDWVFESMIQFLKSPLWTTPINGFIEQHCGEFDPNEEENKLEYTQIHNKFRQLVDDVLSSFLEELGVSPVAFVEACKSGNHPELSAMLTESIVALDDFATFRRMMEKKNVEMDVEAMDEYAKYCDVETSAEVDEEERFLVEMAIRASLGPQEVAMKKMEATDAELLLALAMSLAVEHEKMVKEKAAADAAQHGEIEQRAQATAEKLEENIRQQRVQQVEEAVKEFKSPAKKVTELAPVSQQKPTGNMQLGFGKPLPNIQPSFAQLTQQHGLAPPPASSAPRAPAPAPAMTEAQTKAAADEELVKQRQEYLRAQRDRMRAMKEKQREEELREYVGKMGAAPPPPPPPPAGGGGAPAPSTATSGLSDEEKQMRAALARRFKEDLIHESRK